MFRQLVILLSLAISMTFAAVPNHAHLKFDVRTGEDVTSESIDVNYRDNYVIISTPAHQNAQPLVMLHDYNQGVNMVKQDGYCFVLDQFENLPENIEDWVKIKNQKDDVEEIDGNVMILKHFYYRALPFIVDRSSLPKSIRGFCSGPIRVLVLEEVREGKVQNQEGAVSDNPEGEKGGVAEVFLPGKERNAPNRRVKRQSSTSRISGGRNSEGAFFRGSFSGNNGRGTSGSINGGYNFGSRNYNVGGSVSHTRGSFTGTARGNYHNRGGGSVGGSVSYNRGNFNAGLSGGHNFQTHDTNVRATLSYRF